MTTESTPPVRSRPVTGTGVVDLTVVIATHQRAGSLDRTLSRLSALPDPPRVVVVANGCTDTTDVVVREHSPEFPALRFVSSPVPLGAVARNIGVGMTDTTYVAFCDDDSWWAPGSLETAVGALETTPGLALVCASTDVGDDLRPDPINDALRDSPIPERFPLPGPAVRGFLACAAVVRRDAFTRVGGFSPVIGFVGEEALLAIDLVSDGWEVCYVESARVVHDPSPDGNRGRRDLLASSHRLLIAVMRRPVWTCLRIAGQMIVEVAARHTSPRVLLHTARRLPAAVGARQVVSARLEQELRLLEAGGR